ncbi:hypothetical protein BC829DRAFT_437157 [Chytridium lagenaria]|nr:hypothetical protein BC829DRAFT_437157 [Chytridium lagenaria]
MATNYTNAQYPRDSLAYTEASATNTDYEEARPSTSPRSAASDVQLVPATAAASSSSGHQQGSSSAASPLSSGGSKRQFWTRRRRIFCFVCLGLIFVIAAVMIPVLIYVILPNIVQTGELSIRLSAANFTQVTNDTVAFNLDMNIGNAGAPPYGHFLLQRPQCAIQWKRCAHCSQTQEFLQSLWRYLSHPGTLLAQSRPRGMDAVQQGLVLNRDFTWTISADVRVVVFNPITVAASMTKRPLGAQAFNNFNQGTNSPLTPRSAQSISLDPT